MRALKSSELNSKGDQLPTLLAEKMIQTEEIVPVREAHRLNVKALADYLKESLKGFSGELTVHQFGYGQSNPTFLLSAAGKEYVLRKKPPGKLLPSAHAVEREYRVIKAMKGAGVPVPEPFHLCEDPAVIGTAFYLMERVKGRIFRDPIASEARDARERAAIFEAMNEILARIHGLEGRRAVRFRETGQLHGPSGKPLVKTI